MASQFDDGCQFAVYSYYVADGLIAFVPVPEF